MTPSTPLLQVRDLRVDVGERTVLRSVQAVGKGDTIEVQLADGSLGCRVENIEERKNGCNE